MPRDARPTTVYPIALRELEVRRVEDLTPGMRRVTLTGEQLEAHATPEGFTQRAFASEGFDDDVRLFFRHPGSGELVLPRVRQGGISFPTDPRPLTKVYTVRRYDPLARELDIDCVRHGVGVATTWAYRTTPGERIHVAGPSSSQGLPAGFDELLVVGDDTALPAIARLLDELPHDARAQVLIEVAEDAHRQELRALPGVQVTWLSREGTEPGTATGLLDALAATPVDPARSFAWIAGEQAVVRDLRRHLIEDRGMDRSAIDFTGYWKRSQVDTRPEDAALPTTDAQEETFERFHEQATLLPPLAIRAAANLGIAEHLVRGTTTLSALASATQSDERALGKLLRYLAAIKLLIVTDAGEYALTETGEYLSNEQVLDALRRDGVQARKELALHGLEEFVRTGHAAYASVTGQDFASLRTQDWFERALLEDTAAYAGYVATPLAASASLAGLHHVVVHSDAAGTLAAALTSAHPGLRVTIAALPSHAAWLRADLPTTIPDGSQRERVTVVEQSAFEATPAADAVLIVDLLATLPDPDAALLLRRAAGCLDEGGRILLVEQTLETDEVDEEDAEYDLLCLTLHGGGHRTATELDDVVRAAGLTTASAETLGWGDTLRVLR